MGDNNQGIFLFIMHLFKNLNQVAEAPQINTRFRLIEYGKRSISCNDCSNFNTFQFSAGETGIYFAIDIISGAQTHLGEKFTCACSGQLVPGSQGNQVLYLNAFKANGLLDGKADSKPGTFGNIHVGNVGSVKNDFTGGGLFNAHNQFG